ncbi:MAG: peroxide stress protein YaaA [Fusobacteria bacterium]|nr:MAG: peroxide stress protein YaaA [Fusobacteriota bacterium]
MKIIFSPSKSMNFKDANKNCNKLNIRFLDSTNILINNLKNLNSEELSKLMKIKGKTLENVINFYKNFEISSAQEAIYSYNGISFKQLELKKYNTDQLNYLNSNLIILSALYGVVRPLDCIKEYRLDMTMKLLKDQTLYNFWKDKIKDYFDEDELIINLASKEFSKMVSKPMINIDFKEYKNGNYKSISSYSKKGRGMMLNFMIKNRITNIEKIKEFNLDGYKLNPTLSDEFNFIFTR